MANDKSGELFAGISNPEGTQLINSRCVIRTREGFRVVAVSGIPLAQYAMDDHMSAAHAMVSLVNQGWADQDDVAQTTGINNSRNSRRNKVPPRIGPTAVPASHLWS